MDAIFHAVGIEAIEQALDQFIGLEADVHEDGFRAFIEAFDMRAEEGNATLDQAQAFPHTVAQNEAGVEHRDHCLGPRHQLAVDGDQDAEVAGIDLDVVDGLLGILHAQRLSVRYSKINRRAAATATRPPTTVAAWGAGACQAHRSSRKIRHHQSRCRK